MLGPPSAAKCASFCEGGSTGAIPYSDVILGRFRLAFRVEYSPSSSSESSIVLSSEIGAFLEPGLVSSKDPP